MKTYRIETTDNVHHMQYLPHVRTVRVQSMRMLEIWKTVTLKRVRLDQMGSEQFCRGNQVKENQIGSDQIMVFRSDQY